MEIILLEKIPNLGNLGDKVTVRPGYGRNYLIPHGKAVAATAAKLAEFEARRADLEKKAKDDLTAAQARAAKLADVVVTIAQKAGDEGRLYGSIGTKDIADAATAAGIAINKSEIRLSSGPIRNTGDHEVSVQLHGDVVAILNLKVVPE